MLLLMAALRPGSQSEFLQAQYGLISLLLTITIPPLSPSLHHHPSPLSSPLTILLLILTLIILTIPRVTSLLSPIPSPPLLSLNIF